MEANPLSQWTAHDGRFVRVRAALPVALALAAGLVLRLWLLKKLFEVNGDALIYGGVAKNLLLHGRYALNGAGAELYPTLIRLPGYPLFLAVCFRIFGMENYASAAWVQIALELCGCLLLAGFVRRVAPAELKAGAALATLWLAALCPFTASYAVVPLAETPTLFAMALALWALARFHARPGWSHALLFTFAVTWAALLRPDGALLGAALAPAMIVGLKRGNVARRKLARMGLVCTLLVLLPFGAWAWRNWQVFHVFEPLAPRLATDPGEDPHPGWERWVKSWCLDFVSTYDIYWNEPDEPLDLSKLPGRAFDSPAQYAETAALIADYNSHGYEITPEMDARFGRLADERAAAHPLRSYVWLPLGRLADMTLRPRVENLPIDLDWWAYAHHRAETRFSWAYAGLNAVYLLLGLAGVWLCARGAGHETKQVAKKEMFPGGQPPKQTSGPKQAAEKVQFPSKKPEDHPSGSKAHVDFGTFVARLKPCPFKAMSFSAAWEAGSQGLPFSSAGTENHSGGLQFWPWMVAYMAMRSALLLTVEAPEARYTLEFFPMLFALGGIALYGFFRHD